PAGLQRWLAGQRAHAGDGAPGDDAQLRLESDEALVRIATVHAVKGLQFPVVILPYAPFLGTGGGAPGTPPVRWHEEDGGEWLAPGPQVEATHQGQAIRERRAEGVRLLYVALTRAEQAIMLPWCRANGAQNSALGWVLHAADGAPGERWAMARTAPDWFTPASVAARLAALEQAGGGSIRVRELPATLTPPRRLARVMVAPGPARDDFPAARPSWRMLSYSALLRGESTVAPEAGGRDDESGPLAAPAEDFTAMARAADVAASGDLIPDEPALAGLGGSAFGSAVHDLLEHVAFADWPAPGQAPSPAERRQVGEQLQGQGLALAGGITGERQLAAVAGLVSRCLHTPLPEIGALAAVPPASRLAEMGFVMRLGGQSPAPVSTLLQQHGYTALPAGARAGGTLQGLMQGFIDLVVEQAGRYWVIDYKTNRLGPAAVDYAPARLAEAVRRGHYDLQYLIYLVALHRHLRLRLPGYRPEQHLGGAQYLFLRGMNGRDAATGVFVDRPAVSLIEALDRLFDGAPAA
ncbi:MAG: PD-(D/E)XK nuclease family protein, partial [Gammaproteobacteria bacterium]|nr:PD-(D/E)XK nuclease family protein [Gammaproteobacteria bacterium]